MPDQLWRRSRILEQVHDAVVSTDLDGIIRSWNAAAVRIYGWTPSEVIGRHLGLLYFEEDVARLEREIFEPLRTADFHEITLRNRHRSGREIFVALRLSLLRDDEGRPIGAVGCSNDVTAQKLAEETLREVRRDAEESTALVDTLFHTAPVGLGFVDRDLRFVRVNDALAEINGLSAAEHGGRPLAEVVPELASTLEPIYRRVIDERRAQIGVEIEGTTSARPGELRHWLASYYPVESPQRGVLGVGIILLEVTERKRAREALQRERDLSEGLIETAQAIVLVLDPQGRIVRFNRFMEKLAGYRLEEVRGRSWFDVFLPSRDRSQVRRVFGRAVKGSRTRGHVNPILTRDGSERIISWWDTPLTEADGSEVGILAIGHDMTELVEAQERALRSERLAAIGETIATISHESANELVAIGMGLRTLAESNGDEAQREVIRLLRRSHAQLDHLFRDLRDFAAPIKLFPVSLDLSGVWRRAWERLAPKRGGRAAALRETLSGAPAICPADPVRMEQVFRNLFENALAACPDPVEIEISCETIEGVGGRRLRVFVRDNGPGLAKTQRDRAFEAFFSTTSEGTGLGLPLVRRILEKHGGTATLGASTRRGAELVLTLPLTAEPVPAS